MVVALNGVPVIVDAGRPTYTAQTFGPDRYDIWTMQSSWHNVPEIRATAQAAGAPVRRPRRVGAHRGDAGSLALDLAGAYPREDIRHWRREARLDRVAPAGSASATLGARSRTRSAGGAPAVHLRGRGHGRAR